MNKITVDVTLGLQYGDEAKGKVTHFLASGKHGKNYTHVIRVAGGQNAGHTIYHKGKKYATHIIPAGVFHGIKSVIGPGCVFNVNGLLKEIQEVESQGEVNVMKHLRIAANSHIITEAHLAEEQGETAVGTTKRGNGPAYRDKYARKGLRAEQALKGTVLEPLLVDMYEEFYKTDSHNPKRVLVEGAQGFFLDVDWGDYPYVTSSHCGLGGVFLNGFTHKQIDTVYGVAKCYETYVGAKEFEDRSNPILSKIQEVGKEIGVTSGRRRQCNYLNLDRLLKACDMNAVDILIISKLDVLREVGEWSLFHNAELKHLQTEERFREYTENVLKSVQIKWSDSPERI